MGTDRWWDTWRMARGPIGFARYPRDRGGRLRRYLVLTLILGLNPKGPAVGGDLPDPGRNVPLIQVFRPTPLEFRGGDAPLFQADWAPQPGVQGSENDAGAPPSAPFHTPFFYNGGT